MNNKLKYATCALLTTLMLVSMLLVTFPIGSYAQTPISFIGTEEIIFSSTTEMTIKSPETMQFWSGEQMAFGSTIKYNSKKHSLTAYFNRVTLS